MLVAQHSASLFFPSVCSFQRNPAARYTLGSYTWNMEFFSKVLLYTPFSDLTSLFFADTLSFINGGPTSDMGGTGVWRPERGRIFPHRLVVLPLLLLMCACALGTLPLTK